MTFFFIITFFVFLSQAYVLFEINRQNQAKLVLNISGSDISTMTFDLFHYTSLPPELLLPEFSIKSLATPSATTSSSTVSTGSIYSDSWTTKSNHWLKEQITSTGSINAKYRYIIERYRKYRYSFIDKNGRLNTSFKIDIYLARILADIVFFGYVPNWSDCNFNKLLCIVYNMTVYEGDLISEDYPVPFTPFCDAQGVITERICIYYNIIKEAKLANKTFVKNYTVTYESETVIKSRMLFGKPYGVVFLIAEDCIGTNLPKMAKVCSRYTEFRGYTFREKSEENPHYEETKIEGIDYELAIIIEDLIFFSFGESEVCSDPQYNNTIIPQVCAIATKNLTWFKNMELEDCCWAPRVCTADNRICYYHYIVELRDQMIRERDYRIELLEETECLDVFYYYSLSVDFRYNLTDTLNYIIPPPLPRGASAVIRRDCTPKADKYIRKICQLKNWSLINKTYIDPATVQRLRLHKSSPTYRMDYPQKDAKNLTAEDVADMDKRKKRRHNGKYIIRPKWRSGNRQPLWPKLTSTPDYWFIS